MVVNFESLEIYQKSKRSEEKIFTGGKISASLKALLAKDQPAGRHGEL